MLVAHTRMARGELQSSQFFFPVFLLAEVVQTWGHFSQAQPRLCVRERHGNVGRGGQVSGLVDVPLGVVTIAMQQPQ